MLDQAKKKLRAHADETDAKFLQRYFKTGPGEYGEGDVFIGVRVPVTRRVAREFKKMRLADVQSLLHSAIHEERLLGLIILTEQYPRAHPEDKARIYKIYMDNLAHINNWDLVDSSAYKIVGAYLVDRSRRTLYKLARSNNLWERRIAIMSTLAFIVHDEFADTLAIAEMLLNDPEDLIHKAVGWMLREIGNRDRETEESFLRKHYGEMPRTMLRYAIEKFPEPLRQAYLKGNA